MKPTPLTITSGESRTLIKRIISRAAVALVCALDQRITCRRVYRSESARLSAIEYHRRAEVLMSAIWDSLRGSKKQTIHDKRRAVRAMLLAEVRLITDMNPNGIVANRRPAIRVMQQAA